MANPVGRPTDYTPEIAEAVCSWIAGGDSLRAYCRQEGVPDVSTVCRWIKSDPKFAESYELARAKSREETGRQWKIKSRAGSKSLRKLVKDDYSENRLIYIIGLRGTDMYKVGITNDINRRVKDIQSLNPFEVEVINSSHGGKEMEYALQSVIEPFWVRGEWFECPESFIVGLSVIMEVLKND